MLGAGRDIMAGMQTPAPDFEDLFNTESKKVESLEKKVVSLEAQLDWFKRQLFGRKSEKLVEPNTHQMDLFKDLLNESKEAPKPAETISVPAHTRKKKGVDGSPEDSGLRFDSDVPVKEISIPNPVFDANPDKYDVIAEKNTYRLAQRPSSYVVLKYIRTVIKEKTGTQIITPQAPSNVLEKSFADVSLLAGLVVDKFDYHLPLYRQHRRMLQSGITLSRATLTHLVFRVALLLKPIHQAILSSILRGSTIAMDETPIRYGRKGKGKMNRGYYWPLYGENDEIYFHFSPSRGSQVVFDLLGNEFNGKLLTDGYRAYEKYTNKVKSVTRAQCWSHGRRGFDKSLKSEPDSAQHALQMIAVLYKIEADITEKNLNGDKKREHRQKYSKPIVDQFFNWVDQQRLRTDLINSDPIAKALLYVHDRERAMRVFLDDPEVALDTNHLERGLRPIPMGKKSWLFCWTETGAEHVGIIQSLISTCKLHGVDPYTYLVDVLQRVSLHPASKIEELTPRNWKVKFGDNPMKSDLET